MSQLGQGTTVTAHPKPGPRSATVVIRAYGILAAILDTAVRDRRILANPARGVSLPRKVRLPHTYLTHEQVELPAINAGKYDSLVRGLAYTGIRWGEATALRVQDVDTLRRRLTIRENAVRVSGHIIVGTPKNHSARTVPFPEFLTLEIARACEGKDASRSSSETAPITSSGRRTATAGSRSQSRAPWKPTGPSDVSRRMISVKPPQASRSRPVETSKLSSECSVTHPQQ